MASRRILLAMPDAMQQEFGELAAAEGIDWTGVTTCDEARSVLAGDEQISTVVTEGTLPDGSWYCLLEEIVLRGSDRNLIVLLPQGSDPAGITSCGAAVVEYPLDAAARSRLTESLRAVASRAPVA